MARTIKSQAQEDLADLLSETYPFATVKQETHIKKLIEARGYEVKELEEELGSTIHRMFVDIIVSDSEGDVAYEYHGEQHYHQIGKMTETRADLLLNQKLDEEKSWVLSRIGLPLVAIPYDSYVDSAVIEKMTAEAKAECERSQNLMYICEQCGRRYPSSRMPWGCCKRCHEEEKQRIRNYELPDESCKSDYEPLYGRRGEDDEQKAARKQKAKEQRQAAYRAWKESDAYRQQKEYAKQQRRKQSEAAKAQRKREREEAKRKAREEE